MENGLPHIGVLPVRESLPVLKLVLVTNKMLGKGQIGVNKINAVRI